MRGFMFKKYGWPDYKIVNDLAAYLIKHPKAKKKKEQCFKHLVNRYGCMDRDDFNWAWKELLWLMGRQEMGIDPNSSTAPIGRML